MAEGFIQKINSFVRELTRSDDEIRPPIKTMEDLVTEARDEWLAATEYFQEVSEPELVDYAIRNLDAAEKRYNYLLRQVRET